MSEIETNIQKTEIFLAGLNHKTAPVELRERIAFSQKEILHALEVLSNKPGIGEITIISTCNRVETLMVAQDKSEALENVKEFISELKQIPLEQFDESLYVHEGDEAVRHIFRVAASLDSMMVGEPQILGQVKEAYYTSTRKKTSGVILNRLMHRAFFVAKRIRTETGIGDNAVSISYAAIELCKKIFGRLNGKKTLLVGAGEMAELAVEHLIHSKAGDIIVANRTFEKGVELANRFNGYAVKLDEITECLKSADIIISSTGSKNFIITRDQVKAVMRTRKNRPLFFIDIAVPRDIEPAINRLNNAYVYDIDDLQGVIDENIEDRNKESVKGERIVDEAVINFRKWRESLEVVPTIVALRKKFDLIAEAEVNKTLKSLNGLSLDKKKLIHTMTNSLINKILHEPTLFLKKNGCKGDHSIYIDITKKLFNLDS